MVVIVNLLNCAHSPIFYTTNDVAQHGGHPANTKSCSLGLQHISLILAMHIMCN